MSKEYSSSLERKIEFEKEKEHLNDTVLEIKNQILDSIDKRKEAYKNILKYRKNVLEESKNGEEEEGEYTEHERVIQEEVYTSFDKKLNELVAIQDSPYFGRIDINDDELSGVDSIYIGKFGVSKKDEIEPLIVDWRAPVSSLFYTDKLGDEYYNAPDGPIKADILLKRQYLIKKRELKGMFDTSMNVQDEILQMVLSANASEKMKDIVMTIQSEQDKIIRQPLNAAIVVNGVAGSGKTTIALHRVAYLIYNNRKKLENKVLILGPNSIFIDYISTVLPGLGEKGVRQMTFYELACKLLKIHNSLDFKNYMERILSNDIDFIKGVLYKNSLKFIDELDTLVLDMENNYFKPNDVIFNGEKVISKEEILSLLNKDYKYMPLFRRSMKIKRIIINKLRYRRDDIYRVIQKEYKAKMEGLSNEELNLHANEIEYSRKLKISELVDEVINTKKQLQFLDPPCIMEVYEKKFGVTEIGFDDLAPILYLAVKLEGLKCKEDIKHVVIDEAQDFSMLQFIVVRLLTGCRSYTIVGDLNQRIIPSDGEPAANNVEYALDKIDVKRFELNKSYRSTEEIMTYANKFIESTKKVPLVRHGDAVLEQNYSNDSEFREKVFKIVEKYKEKGYESISIVTKNLSEANKVKDVLEGSIKSNLIRSENQFYRGGISIIPSYFAKGIEFDCVILFLDKKDGKDSGRLHYVMATRALHELCVIYKG